ncbi:MAG TPA: hypothetical protein VF519_01650 [Mycobacteriales bacterium]|jgi:hypothetical protein
MSRTLRVLAAAAAVAALSATFAAPAEAAYARLCEQGVGVYGEAVVPFTICVG